MSCVAIDQFVESVAVRIALGALTIRIVLARTLITISRAIALLWRRRIISVSSRAVTTVHMSNKVMIGLVPAICVTEVEVW